MVHLSNTEVFVVRNQLQADLESELVVELNLNPDDAIGAANAVTG